MEIQMPYTPSESGKHKTHATPTRAAQRQTSPAPDVKAESPAARNTLGKTPEWLQKKGIAARAMKSRTQMRLSVSAGAWNRYKTEGKSGKKTRMEPMQEKIPMCTMLRP